MKKIFILILVIASYQSFGQVPGGYNLYAVRTNNDATKDSFMVKWFTDSVFTKQLVYIQRTKAYYDHFYNPVFPNAFENYVMGADNLWRNIPLFTESGSYTPTLFNTTNVAASTAYECSYLRVGNKVTVFGLVDIDVTAASSTVLGMSLPIASNLSASNDCAGTGSSNAAANLSLGVAGSAANDRALFLFVATSLTNNTYSFTFSYTIK